MNSQIQWKLNRAIKCNAPPKRLYSPGDESGKHLGFSLRKLGNSNLPQADQLHPVVLIPSKRWSCSILVQSGNFWQALYHAPDRSCPKFGAALRSLECTGNFSSQTNHPKAHAFMGILCCTEVGHLNHTARAKAGWRAFSKVCIARSIVLTAHKYSE